MNHSISIITATLNSSKTIADCLASVRDQEVKAEHIILDGGSTDNTLNIVKSYPHVSHIISELDSGIYDAMNKGISYASGDIIGILNSDDFYANRFVLEKVLKKFRDHSLYACYGDLQYVNANDTSKITREWKSGKFTAKSFYWGWMPPHPTFFVRRGIYKKYGSFNLDLGSAADYEIMLRLLVKHEITVEYIPEVLVKMRAGGVSNVSLMNRIKANRMDRKAWRINRIRPYPWTIVLKPLRKIFQYQVF
jgi:glycosyltransferase involved in cell wall biosynthesis